MSRDAAFARANAAALRAWGDTHVLAGVAVQGDFLQPGKTFTLSDGVGITARVPTLVIADGDVPANVVGLVAVCGDGTYRVEEVLPDGAGLTMLELARD